MWYAELMCGGLIMTFRYKVYWIVGNICDGMPRMRKNSVLGGFNILSWDKLECRIDMYWDSWDS